MFMFTEVQIEKFWSRVDRGDPDACWEWQGGTNQDGYGMLTINKRHYVAHRVSFEIATEQEPKLQVLHTCDNPSCVNPKHLFEGTRSQNMQDMLAKGRWTKPVITRKLDCDIASAIRREFDQGAKKRALARKYDIVPKHVRDILDGKVWTQCSGGLVAA
jgi:hypothetical protein